MLHSGVTDAFVQQSCSSAFRISLRTTIACNTQFMVPIDYDYIDVPGDDEDVNNNKQEQEEEDEDDEDENVYQSLARSEFETASESTIDWGGALGKLRERMGDIGGKPSKALFRSMLAEGTPNEAILKFVQDAKPDVVSAMSGAVSSLLGGLSNPAIGVETIVKADEAKLGSLCFQLQMTGYMFRNAEYVIALKDLMKLHGDENQYKEAFDKLDRDGSGYIDAAEIHALLQTVYDDSVPPFEVDAFLKFFDSNRDGKISWDEFKRGLDTNARRQLNSFSNSMEQLVLEAANNGEHDDELDDDNDDDEYDNVGEISGMIEVELEDGKVIQVEAKDYIQGLKEQAKALRQALRQEVGESAAPSLAGAGPPPTSTGIGQYIASLGEGNLQKLTEGISPQVVEAMKLLIEYVLDQGQTTKKSKRQRKPNEEMEIAGSALQQLALWQLVLGYRLREQEATGNWKRLLDQ